MVKERKMVKEDIPDNILKEMSRNYNPNINFDYEEKDNTSILSLF